MQAETDREPHEMAPTPLGFLSTLRMFLLSIAGGLIGSLLVAPFIMVILALAFHFAGVHPVGSGQPLLQSIAVLAYYLTSTLILALATRRAGWSPGDYFALAWPKWRDVAVGAAGLAVLVIAFQLLGHLFSLGQKDEEYLVKQYRASQAASLLPLYWLTTAVVAPVCEELMFRGFLFRGWSASWLGVTGTVVATSLLFGGAHFQYSGPGVFSMLCLGLLFAWLRIRSGTIIVPIIMHMLNNLIVMVELAAQQGRTGVWLIGID
jgi:uncharacterized protein